MMGGQTLLTIADGPPTVPLVKGQPGPGARGDRIGAFG